MSNATLITDKIHIIKVTKEAE